MQDIQEIMNEITNDLSFTRYEEQNMGRFMYRNYCRDCYTVFNLFDVLEKHHVNLRSKKELIPSYYTIREKLKEFLTAYKTRDICRCDTTEDFVVLEEDAITGQAEVQYNIFSHELFLHYDYLELDPMRLLRLQGREDENIVQRVDERIVDMMRMIDIDRHLDRGFVEQDLEDWVAHNERMDDIQRRIDGDDTHSEQEVDEDPLVPIESVVFENPVFVDGDGLPITPIQTTHIINTPDAPIRQRQPSTGDIFDQETMGDARRRLEFDDIEIQDHQDIDDIEDWIRDNINILVDVSELEHPVLTRLLRQGHQPLHPVTPGASIYSTEYRLNYRLSQKNFLIKTYYEDEQGLNPPSVRVYRNVSALIEELELWLDYFEKNHETIVNTTILSLQTNLANDCIYNIMKFI